MLQLSSIGNNSVVQPRKSHNVQSSRGLVHGRQLFYAETEPTSFDLECKSQVDQLNINNKNEVQTLSLYFLIFALFYPVPVTEFKFKT